MKRYISSLDNTATIVPYFMVVLSVVIFIAGTYLYKKTGLDPLMFYVTILPVSLLLLGIVTAMYFLKPLAVVVDNNAITVERKGGPVVIPFSEIRSVKAPDAADMKLTIRTFGNGGVFGYTGRYYNKKLGGMTWYCTQRKNYVLIEKTDGKKIMVTPDEPQNLLEELKSQKIVNVVN